MSSSTAAEFVGQLRSTNHFRINQIPWWATSNDALAARSQNKADPWKKKLPKGSSEKTVVQPHVTCIIKELAKDKTTLRMLDTHDKVSLFNRKPDICVCPAEYAATLPAAWYIVAIGDIKGRRLGQEEFTDGEIGSLVSFLQDLLRARPDRTQATGFLTDSFIIQFFRLHVASTGVVMDYDLDATPVYFLKRQKKAKQVCGGDWLRSLLLQSPHTLGCPITDLSVAGSMVEIVRYLGDGSSSVVWQGKHKGCDVVVKIFRMGHEDDLEAELENLAKVEHLSGVTKCVASNSDSKVLLLSPVGTPFSWKRQEGKILPLAGHFAQLVSIVESAHNVCLLHRDLNWTNFFLGPDGKVRVCVNNHVALTKENIQ